MKRGPLVLELLDAMNTWKAVFGALLFFVVLDGFLFYIGPSGIVELLLTPSLLLWGIIITFLIMLGLLYWFVYAPIRDQIRQRQHSADLAPPPPEKTQASGWSNPNPDGSCLSEYPIKGNINSKGEYIYHRPTGRCYSRTKAEVCFATESDARNVGFRPSRR